MKNYMLLLFCFCYSINSSAQVSVNTEDALESYTLLEASNIFYLINNCGEVVNSWGLQGIRHHAKLLPSGKLLYINYASSTIVERNWDGTTHASYPITDDPRRRLNYEVVKMPNGNYLSVGRKTITFDELEELGWEFSIGLPTEYDVVIEYDPNLNEVVWEWSIMEHAIQETIPSGSAYGVVKDHPELLDMAAIGDYDWNTIESFMINGMDYNPELDQIALSIRKMGEVVIIDHSTTKEEVKGHTGGKHGKGGDIIYRWGDPGNYGRETEDQKKELYYQHNPKWITSGVHKGKISMYNNMLDRYFPGGTKYSSAYIIDPPMDANGFYILEGGKPYGPVEPTLKIDEETSSTWFRSDYGSGVEVLPNENIFISNATGRLMEVDATGTIHWEYQIPFANFVFRCQKYPKDYIGFMGQDLTSSGEQIPGAIADASCVILNNVDSIEKTTEFSVNYRPELTAIQIKNPAKLDYTYLLYNIEGRVLAQGSSSDLNLQINTTPFLKGMYFIALSFDQTGKKESHKIMLH